MASYRGYLEENAKLATEWTAKLRGQIAVHQLNRAESRYATARVQVGQISPVLAPDGAVERMYRRVEAALFNREDTLALKADSVRLLGEVEALQQRIEGLHLSPRVLLAGAVRALRRVATAGPAGRLEPQSHLDFVDIAATVEGVEAAFRAVAPLTSDHRLPGRIEKQFLAVYNELKPYGFAAREPQSRAAAAGARWVSFAEVAPADRQQLARPLRKLLRLLEELQLRS